MIRFVEIYKHEIDPSYWDLLCLGCFSREIIMDMIAVPKDIETTETFIVSTYALFYTFGGKNKEFSIQEAIDAVLKNAVRKAIFEDYIEYVQTYSSCKSPQMNELCILMVETIRETIQEIKTQN